jgi:hypothetical protein
MSTATTTAPTLQSPVPVRAEDVQPPGYKPPAAGCLETHTPGIRCDCGASTSARDYRQGAAADGDR